MRSLTRWRLARRPAGAPAHDCSAAGHRFGIWLACGCDQAIRDHHDASRPGGFFGDGSCAFEFRSCAFCPADEERHLADGLTPPGLAAEAAGIDLEHRSGGFLRQDVPAGPALPNHHTTSEHVSSKENAMVERASGDGRAVPVAVDVVSPGKGLITSGAGDFSGTVIRDRERRSGYLVENEWGEVIGRAGSYRDGAARLAHHHGCTADPIEVDVEHRDEWSAR